uniref:Uncharacterized protein n=1 Tax=uncultured prokaryote TaxID=198431 RepID=A0A0H5QP29_9ZZZZ|nr:hypothetical protein [uncultured prokaryote]
MANRPTEERIAELDKKLEQIKAKKRALQNRAKTEERKARTKRLIAIGAEVEHYAGCEISDLEAFKKYLEQYAYAIARTQKTAPEER